LFTVLPANAGICSAPGGEEYRVRWGDTLSHIVRLYRQDNPNLTMADILAMPENSDIINPNLIYPGNRICIPIAQITWGSVCHPVVWGDTMSGYASMTGYSLQELMMNAKIANPDWIFAGETILMPPQGTANC
jgi:LysM repeat protein